MEESCNLALLYLTVQGDFLIPEELKALLNLPCKVYHKGEIACTEFNGKRINEIKRKTNRWLYVSETKFCNDEELNIFISEQLGMLNSFKSVLQPYFEKYYSYIRLSLYMDDNKRGCILLNPKQIHLIDSFGIDFEIEFS